MSETDEIENLGRRLLEKSRQSPLRERMADFVDDHGPISNPKAVRAGVGRGRAVSDVVVDDRDERQ